MHIPSLRTNSIGAVLLSALSLSGGVAAQSAYSPLPKYQTYVDTGGSLIFGAYSHSRWQMGEGNYPKSLPVIVRIAFRPSTSVLYDSYFGMGRSWGRVTIDMAGTSLRKMGSRTTPSFAANHLSTPARVFSASVTWKTRTGVIGSGAIRAWNDHTFSFTKPWIRPRKGPGASDFLADYEFRGGALANMAAWPAAAARYYLFDSYSVASAVYGRPTYYYDTTTTGCRDSLQSPVLGRGSVLLEIKHVAAGVREPFQAIYFSQTGTGPGPLTPFVSHVAFSVNRKGFPFGSGCERRFITGPILSFPGVTDAAGNIRRTYFGLTGGKVRYHPALIGLTIATQATWNDSVNGSSKVTGACSMQVPPLADLTSQASARRLSVYSLLQFFRPTRWGPMHVWNPICRYN